MALGRECPFCGNKRVIIDTLKNARGEAVRYRNSCAVCGASTRWFETEGAAAEAWDRRSAPAAEAPETPVIEAPAKAVKERKKRREESFINKDLFLYRGAVYARNPHTQWCYRDQGEGYKRIKKAEYLLVYAELAKRAEEQKWKR